MSGSLFLSWLLSASTADFWLLKLFIFVCLFAQISFCTMVSTQFLNGLLIRDLVSGFQTGWNVHGHGSVLPEPVGGATTSPESMPDWCQSSVCAHVLVEQYNRTTFLPVWIWNCGWLAVCVWELHHFCQNGSPYLKWHEWPKVSAAVHEQSGGF